MYSIHVVIFTSQLWPNLIKIFYIYQFSVVILSCIFHIESLSMAFHAFLAYTCMSHILTHHVLSTLRSHLRFTTVVGEWVKFQCKNYTESNLSFPMISSVRKLFSQDSKHTPLLAHISSNEINNYHLFFFSSWTWSLTKSLLFFWCLLLLLSGYCRCCWDRQ